MPIFKPFAASRKLLSALLIMFGILNLSCRNRSEELTEIKAVKESNYFYRDKVIPTKQPALPLLSNNIPNYIDIRGVGDSGWVDRGARPKNVTGTPVKPNFGSALAKIDPDKSIFAADISFINWEAVITKKCKKVRQSVSFAFYSHPDNILQAANHGFNLFGLSNNHAGDCNLDENGLSRGSVYDPSLKYLNQSLSTKIALAGAGADNDKIKILTKVIKGKTVRIAFGSLSFFSWNIPQANIIVSNNKTSYDKTRVDAFLKKFDKIDSDIKILAIHSQDGSNSKAERNAFLAIKQAGEDFIKNHGGHVVFGHGPHTWAGVKLVEKPNGSFGVLFSSLGNFIHQGLSIRKDNYLGRVLLDPNNNFSAKQVFVFPLVNQKNTVKFYNLRNRIAPPKANFSWNNGTYRDGRLLYYFADIGK